MCLSFIYIQFQLAVNQHTKAEQQNDINAIFNNSTAGCEKPLPHEKSPSAPHLMQLMRRLNPHVCVCVCHLPTGFAFSQASQSVAMFYNRNNATKMISTDTCNVEEDTGRL